MVLLFQNTTRALPERIIDGRDSVDLDSGTRLGDGIIFLLTFVIDRLYGYTKSNMKRYLQSIFIKPVQRQH